MTPSVTKFAGWTRLCGASWDELRVRGWQEVCKRWDVALYYARIPFGRNVETRPTETRSRFLFEPEDLPGLISTVREKLPQHTDDLVKCAERLCRHQFTLLGYEQLDYGPKIDWHLDIVHGKRAPLKPWYRICYLDFGEVGDAKVTWELNRHQHLVTLAKAYWLTRDQQFAAEVFRQWYVWREENPYPLGINWASSLEVSIRSISWLWVQHLLKTCPVTPNHFSDDLLHALAISGRHIERYLSTYFSPNTHLLGEGVALFFLGTLCPQLRAAQRWQHLGWQIVLQEAARQVQSDGMHFEQSVYYHVYALDFFLHARMLAAANRVPIPVVFDQTVERMLEVLCRLGQTGAPPRFGDDDGGRLFDPHRNRAEHLLDPLSTGAVLFSRPDFKGGGNLCEEAIWLSGREGISKYDKLSATRPALSSIGLQTSGIYVMSGKVSSVQQAVVNAGRPGSGSGGHTHADALSLCLKVNDLEWLVDPGTFAYVSGGNERDLFRETAAHNTLQVDGLSQAEPGRAFGWRSRPKVRVERWTPGEGFDLLVASHDGYGRLRQPVLHRRSIFHLKSRFWLVLDLADGEGSHRLEIFWHLAPGAIARPRTSNCSYFTGQHQTELAVVTPEGHDWIQEINRGWWSPVYGMKEPCSVLRFRKEMQLPADFATVIHPLSDTSTTVGNLVKICAKSGGVNSYLYRTPCDSHYIFFARQEGRWETGAWASDAAFLYCRLDLQGCLRHLALCNGSFVQLEGQRIFSARLRVASCECIQEGTAMQAFCSEIDAIDILPQGSYSSGDVVLAGPRTRDLIRGAD